MLSDILEEALLRAYNHRDDVAFEKALGTVKQLAKLFEDALITAKACEDLIYPTFIDPTCRPLPESLALAQGKESHG